MRAAIRQLFPSRACRTLVRPATDEEAVRHAVGLTTAQLRPEFVSQLEAVRRRPLAPYLRPPPHYSPSLSCPRPPPSGPPRTRRRRSSARLLSRRATAPCTAARAAVRRWGTRRHPLLLAPSASALGALRALVWRGAQDALRSATRRAEPSQPRVTAPRQGARPSAPV